MLYRRLLNQVNSVISRCNTTRYEAIFIRIGVIFDLLTVEDFEGYDNADNDSDNLIDCDDVADCNGQPCADYGMVCDGGLCQCPGGVTETICDDSLDDNCDGLTDCENLDCDGMTCGPMGETCQAGACM